jgi:hypothetical protein
MSKCAALFHVAAIVGILCYTTIELYRGRFDQAMAFVPLLMLYYVFVAARRMRRRAPGDDSPGSNDGGPA